MPVPAVGQQAARTRPRVVPDRLAHVVLRTQQFEPMMAWWSNVLQADIAFKNAFIGFLAFDDEHHRVAIVQPPNVGSPAENLPGLDHVAFTYAGLADLIATYERLKADGLLPYWVVNHGPTLSLYYRDPDGNQAELQIDRFASSEEATDFLMSKAFANHPVGHSVNIEDLVRRFHAGEDEKALIAYRYDHEND
jgi:catechol-2,3-dioxygenase